MLHTHPDFYSPYFWLSVVAAACGAGAVVSLALLIFSRHGQRRSSLAKIRRDVDFQELGKNLLILDPVRPIGRERRTSVRRTGNPIAVQLTDAARIGRPRRAFVLDRSSGGLCLALEDELPVGRVFAVRAENAPDTTPWVPVEVKRCARPSDTDYWEVGCGFVEKPAISTLLLFG